MNIFDRDLLKIRRKKALLRGQEFDFLHREVADRLSERIEEIKRSFDTPLQMGLLGGDIPCLSAHPDLVRADRHSFRSHILSLDEEALNLEAGSFDLITSNLLLHWVNDLPGALVQFNHALKADGLFLGALFGGETLKELRQALMLAESEVSGGVSPRVSPFVDVRDAGSLMQRAGFALPVTDIDTITVNYDNPFKLMADLRGMGESNAVHERRKTLTPPKVLMRAAQIYTEKFAGDDGRVPATFQIVYLTGWKPHESQQQPIKRGSAKMSLAEALKTKEDRF